MMNTDKTTIRASARPENVRLKVKDLGEQFTLIQDSQDVKATLESIGKMSEYDFTGCLFAEVRDGDYGKVYLCPTYVPYLESPVRELQ